MKRSFAVCLSLIAIVLFAASCTKPPLTPGPNGSGGPSGNGSTCTITFDGTQSYTADSTHWDYYSGAYRIQAFRAGVAIFTLYPGTILTGYYTPGYHTLYWIEPTYPNTTYGNTTGVNLQITNNSNVLSGDFTSSGSIYSGSGGASYTQIQATFSNVPRAY